jgi:ketosteroid isomerase-like protein
VIKSVLRISSALTILIAVGCQTKIDVEKENAQLLQTDIEFSKKSVEVGAAEAFKLYLADSAIELPAGGEPVMGGDSIFSEMKGGHYVLQWEPRKAEVSTSGDLGYTWGTYTLTTEDKAGQKKTSYGKYLDVWKKQSDGSWKVLIDIGNQSPAPVDN